MKSNKGTLIPQEYIENKIIYIRNQGVMIDRDIAFIYGVSTKRLNEQVKRNRKRFPDDFMFQISKEEKNEVVANCDHLKTLKFSPNLPYAFTEHGAIMLASVLNSTLAIETSIRVVRAFVKLREFAVNNKELARKIEEIEKKYDKQFKIVFDAIKQLMIPPPVQKRKIGF
jgi:hypothetical protein